ncbi:putative thylakoid lumenal 17.9 kDa protein, chloroplastic [Cocos nucifera]|nr:putative thylakoid lumenal 17.9 kDa protein, chloroplastic [Cocos nucifera]
MFEHHRVVDKSGERGRGKGKDSIVMSITRVPCSPSSSSSVPQHQTPTATSQNSTIKRLLLSSLAPLTLAMTLSSPIASVAIPSPSSQSSPFPSSTPYSQSQNLQLGLENGKIRPCPSTNPGCVSTNPKSSSFAFPWVIPENSSENAVQKLRDAILKTQRNVEIKVDEETANGNLVRSSED